MLILLIMAASREKLHMLAIVPNMVRPISILGPNILELYSRDEALMIMRFADKGRTAVGDVAKWYG